jgi:hypothetical protein
MGTELSDHHCAKGYMCHIIDASLLEESINRQWKLNGIIKDAHLKK